jgi:hypothetical protein
MRQAFGVMTLVATASFALAAGAARFPTKDQLNDADRAVWADDTADVLKPRQLLYETKEDGWYRVSYNLIRETDGDVKGYFVRLTIRNLADNAVVAADEITLVDAENSVIPATDRDTFLGLATSLAGTKAPTTPVRSAARASGGEEDYDKAYLRGQSEGRSLQAAADVLIGRRMTLWADSFWLKPTLELPPHGQISGVRVFLAEPYHPLPLTIRARVGDSAFEFTTRAK